MSMREFENQVSLYKMPKAYSADLRWRIVWLHFLQNKSVKDIGRELYVSESSVERFIHLFRVTGDVLPKKQRYGPLPILNEFEELTVLQTLLDKPGIYLREVQEELNDITGTWISCSTICRTAKKLGLSRQALRRIAIQLSDIHRARHLSEMDEFKPEMYIFIDETGSDQRNSIRKFGYGIRGLTPVTQQLLVYGKRISGIAVMSTRGMEDTYIVEGSVNGDIFLRFIERCLLPIIEPFDGDNPRSVVILDNASIHHVDEAVRLISSAGAIVRFLPPYSPDLMPLEEAFSKVKSSLRDNEVAYQSTLEPRVFVAEAFSTVTQQDCAGYISHAGYM